MTPAERELVGVTIVTGALGAGKTTLVNAALAQTGRDRVAVIVNEFGDVGIDGALIGDRDGSTIELTSGCLCCSVRSELDQALDRVGRSGIEHVLVETTGIADPGPVIESVADRPDLLYLDTIVCVADARSLPDQLRDDRRPEVARQLELAASVALSKTDVAGPGRTIASRERIAQLNPLAAVHDARRGAFPPSALFGAAAFAPRAETSGDAGHRHDHHGAHAHEVESISVGCDGDLDLDRLTGWLHATLAFKGPDLNRVKGVLAIAGERHRVVIHGVQGYLEIATGAAWDGEPRRSAVVAIGHRLEADLWEQALRDCRAEPSPASGRR